MLVFDACIWFVFCLFTGSVNELRSNICQGSSFYFGCHKPSPRANHYLTLTYIKNHSDSELANAWEIFRHPQKLVLWINPSITVLMEISAFIQWAVLCIFELFFPGQVNSEGMSTFARIMLEKTVFTAKQYISTCVCENTTMFRHKLKLHNARMAMYCVQNCMQRSAQQYCVASPELMLHELPRPWAAHFYVTVLKQLYCSYAF